jgi:hypothetical protein
MQGSFDASTARELVAIRASHDAHLEICLNLQPLSRDLANGSELGSKR